MEDCDLGVVNRNTVCCPPELKDVKEVLEWGVVRVVIDGDAQCSVVDIFLAVFQGVVDEDQEGQWSNLDSLRHPTSEVAGERTHLDTSLLTALREEACESGNIIGVEAELEGFTD